MKKHIDCGKLRFEVSEALPNGTEVEIWESDNLIRPSSRILRVTLSPDATRRLLEELNGMAVTSKLTVYQPASPQPVATLCDAAEALMLFVDQHCNYHDLDPLLADVRHALTAERKRAVLVDKVIQANRSQLSPDIMDAPCGCPCCEAIAALDAFDKGAENG